MLTLAAQGSSKTSVLTVLVTAMLAVTVTSAMFEGRSEKEIQR
jgi:hypothetical protein